MALTKLTKPRARWTTFKLKVAKAVSRSLYERLLDQGVSIKDFGAVGDGVTVDRDALQAALDYGGVITLTPNSVFNIAGQVNISKPVIIKGQGSKLLDASFYNAVGVDGLSFINLVQEGTPTSGSFAPRAIRVSNSDNVTIKGCKFVNCNVRVFSDTGEAPKGVRVSGCMFDSDFTNFNYETSQEDLLQIYGAESLSVKDNIFMFKNVHRVMKISAGLESGVFDPVSERTLGVSIKDNFIIGDTTSNKQVVDMFIGTTNVDIAGNYVKVKGFSSVFEQKTGYPYEDEDGNTDNVDVFTSLIARNNHIDSEGIHVNIQGAYGLVDDVTGDPKQNSYDSCTISGNTLFKRNSISPAISARFLDDISVNGNKVKDAEPAEASIDPLGKEMITVGSCGTTLVQDNQVTGGYIRVNAPVSNTQGQSFKSLPISYNISDNTLRDFKSRAAIYIRGTGAVYDTEAVKVSSNVITSTKDDSVILSAVWLDDMNVTETIIADNIAKLESVIDKKTVIQNDYVSNVIESGNSWQLLKKGIGSYADGDIITHNMGRTPTYIEVTPITGGSNPYFAYVKNMASNSFILGLEDSRNNSAVTTPIQVSWKTEATLNA